MILHQALKDARLLKWILAIWILLNVALYATVLAGVHVPGADVAEGRPLYTLFVTLRALLIAGFFAFPVLVVQNDPAVGTTATWFTRPVSWRGVVAAKLFLAIPLFVLLLVAGDLAAMLLGGVPIGAAIRPALEAIAVQSAWLLALMALAAITANLAQFVVAMLLEVVLYLLLVAAVQVTWWSARWYTFFYRQYTGFVSPETMQAVFVAAVVVAGLALLAFAYKRRSMLQGIVVAAVLPLVIGLVTITWRWDVAAPFGPRIQSPVEVQLVPDSLRFALRGARGSLDWVLSSRLDVSRVPAGQSVQFAAADAWLQYGSERVAARRLYFGGGQEAGNARRAMLQVLGGRVLTTGGDRPVPSEPYNLGAEIPEGSCRAFENQPGTFDAALKIVVVAHRERTTSGVTAGTTYALNTGEGTIVSVERYRRGITVIARETGLDVKQSRYIRHDYALKNDRRGEVLLIYKRGFTEAPFVTVTALVPVPQHLTATWQELDFAWPEDPSFDVDAWLRDARLVVIESERLGITEKQVQAKGVVISQLPGWSGTR